MHVVATAGHVDHGKSTLVHALTGIDPDRLDEEKRRGLTIDIGFAWTTLASGRELSFVDVPGHVRFIKNMLAGVGGVDACLFVVAATEGWKPQTEEHLRILELLGIKRGLIALTKVGGVDEDGRELARMDVSDHVAGTFLAEAEIVAVDAVAGTGVDAVVAALDRLLAAMPAAVDRGRPRLWIDRAFAARGSGTVVTGTLTGGRFAVHEDLELLPNHAPVRVRGLQTHKTSLEEAGPGRRLAINLTGISHNAVDRGSALVRPGQWEPSRIIDASLSVLASLTHEISRRGAYTAYIGSGEHAVRVRILGTERLAPGAEGLVRIHLPVALPLLPGDRYVLREAGRAETVGGGEILDTAPVLPAARARPTRSVDRVVAERGWVDADLLERLTGERRAPAVGNWVVDPAVLAETQARLGKVIAGAGPLGLDVAALGEHDRAVLATLEEVHVEAGRVRAGADRGDPLADHPYLAALEADPFTPPSPEEAGAARTEVRELVRRGTVSERDGIFFATTAIDAAARRVRELLVSSPDGITVAAVRDALGTTRKYLLPLLGELDARGVTRRRGDVRVAGPRLPDSAG